jgi:hypothetical protein
LFPDERTRVAAIEIMPTAVRTMPLFMLQSPPVKVRSTLLPRAQRHKPDQTRHSADYYGAIKPLSYEHLAR